MSKDTNFSGHPVLSQIIKLINQDKVHKLATTTKVNRYVKSFDAFMHLVVMIYAALSGAKSIRQVVEGFEANVTRLNSPGHHLFGETQHSVLCKQETDKPVLW